MYAGQAVRFAHLTIRQTERQTVFSMPRSTLIEANQPSLTRYLKYQGSAAGFRLSR